MCREGIIFVFDMSWDGFKTAIEPTVEDKHSRNMRLQIALFQNCLLRHKFLANFAGDLLRLLGLQPMQISQMQRVFPILLYGIDQLLPKIVHTSCAMISLGSKLLLLTGQLIDLTKALRRQSRSKALHPSFSSLVEISRSIVITGLVTLFGPLVIVSRVFIKIRCLVSHELVVHWVTTQIKPSLSPSRHFCAPARSNRQLIQINNLPTPVFAFFPPG